MSKNRVAKRSAKSWFKLDVPQYCCVGTRPLAHALAAPGTARDRCFEAYAWENAVCSCSLPSLKSLKNVGLWPGDLVRRGSFGQLHGAMFPVVPGLQTKDGLAYCKGVLSQV